MITSFFIIYLNQSYECWIYFKWLILVGHHWFRGANPLYSIPSVPPKVLIVPPIFFSKVLWHYEHILARVLQNPHFLEGFGTLWTFFVAGGKTFSFRLTSFFRLWEILDVCPNRRSYGSALQKGTFFESFKLSLQPTAPAHLTIYHDKEDYIPLQHCGGTGQAHCWRRPQGRLTNKF